MFSPSKLAEVRQFLNNGSLKDFCLLIKTMSMHVGLSGFFEVCRFFNKAFEAVRPTKTIYKII